MKVKFQPIPSRNIASQKFITSMPASAMAMQAPSRISPAEIILISPNRLIRLPVKKPGANMATVCQPITLVIDPKLWPQICIIAIGVAVIRKFMTVWAIVAETATIGAGSVICPQAVVSDAVLLGRCVLVNYHASLGHDAAAGDYAVFSPSATLGGGAVVEEDVFLGLHATVCPRVRIGAATKVSANSAALVSVPQQTLVYGVPGRSGQRVVVTP